MEKTLKINISGAIFQIEEEAFELLRDYLKEINKHLKNAAGGNEMIEDIEARIAELFQSSPSWKTGVLSKEDVEDVISTMGKPEEIAEESGAEFKDESKSTSKRLYRDTDGAIIGGVCNGLGAYLRIDPVWIRILFVLFTVFYLSGLLVYVILWIALPRASTIFQKRELYGGEIPDRDLGRKIKKEVNIAAGNVKTTASEGAQKVGGVFNEIFRAFGKFFIILFRIIIAIIGVAFIVGGFSTLISYIIIAFFQSPIIMGSFFDTGLFNINDFLTTLAGPALAPWLIILSSLVIILPLIGIIYWGIRMVFQFRAKDLVLNISMFIIWIVSCTALSLILFSEGISFSHTGRVSDEISLDESGQISLFVNEQISEKDYNKTLSLPGDHIKFYLDEDRHQIFGSPELQIYHTDEQAHVQIVKYSSGRTTAHARQQADNLIYNFQIEDNTMMLDDYYTIPEGTMWPGIKIKIRFYIPDGYRIYIQEELEELFEDYQGNGLYSYELGDKTWKMTEDGLAEIDQK